MKWIEFILFLLLDTLMLFYLVAQLIWLTPPSPAFAKVIYCVMCCLVASGTRITYKEARGRE